MYLNKSINYEHVGWTLSLREHLRNKNQRTEISGLSIWLL